MIQFANRYPVAVTVMLLICSNLFMTIAWYGHLKNTRSPLFLAIVQAGGSRFWNTASRSPGTELASER